MVRKLVIFGNGLGRAINNDFFSLTRALNEAWTDEDILSDAQRDLIRLCLPENVIEDEENLAPQSEEELDKLQRVLAACDEIKSYQVPGHPTWLSEEGEAFPAAIRRYLHATASQFHINRPELPNNFFEPLRDWIIDSRSHIATLNYDSLLYSAFIGTRVFSGFSCLIDGFSGEFCSENLNRNRPNRQGYYLHLHGSPLFHTRPNGTLRKGSLSDIYRLMGTDSAHIVLTHVTHKQSVISASPILSEYWQRLEEAMSEVESLVIFGYGGADKHLNLLIQKHFAGKDVQIVERKTAQRQTKEGAKQRRKEWRTMLGNGPKIISSFRDSILDFKEWDYVHEWKK